MREIRWAVLGTGVIANEMAAALGKKMGKSFILWETGLMKRR